MQTLFADRLIYALKKSQSILLNFLQRSGKEEFKEVEEIGESKSKTFKRKKVVSLVADFTIAARMKP